VPTAVDAEVVVVMGVPGAGKSTYTEDLVLQEYTRLNRDERGGSLRQLSQALDKALAAGVRRLVLDNTYLTRAVRSHVIETATRHRFAVRCVWLDTPLAQAQVNLVERLLDRFGALPGPAELSELARSEPGILTPTRQMRAFRELEPPSTDEGFASVQRLPFLRSPRTPAIGTTSPGGVFVTAAALTFRGWEDAVAMQSRDVPHLVFDWRPGETVNVLDAGVQRLAARVSGPVAAAICPHAGGVPACWCRPPLPGLILAFARTAALDPARSTLLGTGPAHRTLATTLGARYVQVGAPPPQPPDRRATFP
jgi:hypothetical protein